METVEPGEESTTGDDTDADEGEVMMVFLAWLSGDTFGGKSWGSI